MNKNILKSVIICSFFLSFTTISPLSIHAKNEGDLQVKQIETTTPENENKASDLTELMGIQTYQINNSENSDEIFENILTNIVKDIPSNNFIKTETNTAPKEAELLKLDNKTYEDELGNKIYEQDYLFGSYLIKVHNFNPNQIGMQKVTIKYRFLSMVEKTKIEISNSTKELTLEDATDNDISNVVSKSIIIDIKDTIAPKIKLKQKSATITKGDNFSIKSYIKSVTDETDKKVKYTISDNYNTNKNGTYKIEITAEDTSGNTSSETFTLKVINPVVIKENVNKSGIVGTALKYKGYPYVRGGTSPSGFDCSGFVQYVYKMNGIEIPRSGSEQSNIGSAVTSSNIKPGDIVVYGYGRHVGIYIGNGNIIHAQTPAKGVGIGKWDYPYNGKVTAIRRVV